MTATRLRGVVAGAWTEEENALVSEFMQLAVCEGSGVAVSYAEMLILAHSRFFAVGRGLLWSSAACTQTARHRDLLRYTLRCAASTVGSVSVLLSPSRLDGEEWVMQVDRGPEPVKALALLAEAAARRVKIPQLELTNGLDFDSNFECCIGLLDTPTPLAMELVRQLRRR